MKHKTAYCFDFDETLVTTTARIHIFRNGVFYKSMNSKEYNFYKPSPRDTFDFSEFKDGELILNAKKYKMWPVLKSISNTIRNKGSMSEIYILTARLTVCQSYIYEFLKQNGIKIELDHIITIGDDAGKIDISKEKRKKLIQLAKQYGKIVFFDDDPKNIAIAAGIQGIKTRLVENYVTEKFEEESDPIHDMGIGIEEIIERILKDDKLYNKLSFKNRQDLQEIFHFLVFKEFYDYADYVFKRYNIDIDYKNYRSIRTFAFHNNIKAIEYCISKGSDINAAYDYANQHGEPTTASNFRLFIRGFKKNNDMRKIELDELDEDAMGGVSAPMATLNNTLGAGTAMPAGPGKIGSGDTWNNTINKKPYTQSASPKRRKKKKRAKKLEEENINPFDKIGTTMAKQMGVKPPFKKKRSKSNQNAVLQRTVEHEIITLDEFIEKLNENK